MLCCQHLGPSEEQVKAQAVHSLHCLPWSLGYTCQWDSLFLPVTQYKGTSYPPAILEDIWAKKGQIFYCTNVIVSTECFRIFSVLVYLSFVSSELSLSL